MRCLLVVLACAMAAALEAKGERGTPKVQVTRTALHVARSLDPDSTETVNVRTRNGDIATLIVRKRGAKSNHALPSPVSVRSSSMNVLEEEEKREGKSKNDASLSVPLPATVRSSGFLIEYGDKPAEDAISIVASPKGLSSPSSPPEEVSKVYNGENNRDEKSINVPPPIYVRSSPMSIKGEQQRTEDFWKRGRSVMHIDFDGIPVIHGVRMPDDESDRQTWRNARVINGILVPYENPGINVHSGDKKKTTSDSTVHHEDLSTNKKTTEGLNPFQPSSYLEHIIKKKHQHTSPHDIYTHARILEYINTVNQRETDRRSSALPRARMIQFSASRSSDGNVNGRRSGDSETQARVLHFPGSSIYPTSLLYTRPSVKTSRVSFEEGVRTPVLQYAHPELGVQPAKVMSKQDEAEEEEDESIRSDKRADEGKTNTVTLAYFAHDMHSDRSPYAYEPGLETNEEQAKVVTVDSNTHTKRSSTDDGEFSSQSNSKQWPETSLAYLHKQKLSDDSYGLGNDKYIKRFPYNGYNTAYFDKSKETQSRYKGQTAGSGYSKYPFAGGYYTIHAHTIQERPFWERVGDTIREHVQTSMEKVSDITRPVVEPLVEATHKISHNLGLASESNRNVIQDKVGSTVAAYPVLLPALGLVAGGAALGLGAVAVGRYLDVDVMKRRVGLREDESDELQAEHKRALESIVRDLSERESTRQGGTWVVAEEFDNPNEQKKVFETAVRALNGGQQSGNKDNARWKPVEDSVTNVRGKKIQRTFADDSVKQDDVEIIESAIGRPNDVTGERNWMLVRSVNPRENERMKKVVDRLGLWARVDDIRNHDDQEKKDIESIVGTLAEHEGIGHQEGSWIVTEDENEERKGRWALGKDDIPSKEKQTKAKRSLNNEVIVFVEEDPDFKSRERISMKEPDISNTHLRTQRELNQEMRVRMGQKLDERIINFDIAENKEHRLVKRSAEKSVRKTDVTIQQLPVSSNHVISKRSTEDRPQQSDNKGDAFSRLEDGEQHLESGQQEILASMSRFVDHKGDWSNTPCAKKIFCDVMVKQPPDALMLMEKKMTTFLSLIQPNEEVLYHLSDVMDAVKRHDCSEFTCAGAVDSPLPVPR
ncbi:uncharacterized protein LOC111867802 isoform X2 [Cryptotermes secundus]|nr:uncharacterized protein LOC111867802 isoform X2 [Cryptotermes secundus]